MFCISRLFSDFSVFGNFAGDTHAKFVPPVRSFFLFKCRFPENSGKPYTYYSWRFVSMPVALPIFWQPAIKSMAHNNHYVVWGAVPAVLACAAGGQPHP